MPRKAAADSTTAAGSPRRSSRIKEQPKGGLALKKAPKPRTKKANKAPADKEEVESESPRGKKRKADEGPNGDADDAATPSEKKVHRPNLGSPLSLTVMSLPQSGSGSSTTSTLTIINEEFDQRVLEYINNSSLATTDLVRKAMSYIASLSKIDVIEGIGEAAPILRAMIDYAPCEQGRRYAACVVICCDNKIPQLVNVANEWVRFLLLPCRSLYFFRRCTNYLNLI